MLNTLVLNSAPLGTGLRSSVSAIYGRGTLAVVGTGTVLRVHRSLFGRGEVTVESLGILRDITNRSAPEERTVILPYEERTVELPE
jgi:hypothetical protein